MPGPGQRNGEPAGVASKVQNPDLLMPELRVYFFKKILQINPGIELFCRVIVRIVVMRVSTKKISFEISD